MARIVFKCRVTGEVVPTGVELSAKSWSERQFGYNRAFCVACKLTHAWSKSEAWLEAEISPPSRAQSQPS